MEGLAIHEECLAMVETSVVFFLRRSSRTSAEHSVLYPGPTHYFTFIGKGAKDPKNNDSIISIHIWIRVFDSSTYTGGTHLIQWKVKLDVCFSWIFFQKIFFSSINVCKNSLISQISLCLNWILCHIGDHIVTDPSSLFNFSLVLFVKSTGYFVI